MGQIGLSEPDRTGQRPPDPPGVSLDQRVDAVGQLGGTSRSHRGHQVGIDLGDHGGEELAYVGADPATTGIEGQGVVGDPG